MSGFVANDLSAFLMLTLSAFPSEREGLSSPGDQGTYPAFSLDIVFSFPLLSYSASFRGR